MNFRVAFQGNLEKKDSITCLPWYMIIYFHPEQLPEYPPVYLDLSEV